MFDTYEEIFNKRAASYHRAMENNPSVRRDEFLWAVQYLEIAHRNIICDVPSGGGYLKDYISHADVSLIFLETSQEFASHCPTTENCSSHITTFEQLPLQSQSVDRVLSLAALHHVKDKRQVLGECHRILKPEGRLVIADIEAETGAANFLNIFVNEFNSMGHRGDFLNPACIEQIAECGFEIISIDRPKPVWSFDTQAQMIDFSRDLFGLDKASNDDILKGITTYLQETEGPGEINLSWELTYLSAAAT